MSEERTILRVEKGALLDVPVYCNHRRGRNWAATIDLDPRSPGGLARRFWERARGAYYYIVPDWLQISAVEFGADYYTSSGKKHAERWYGVVVERRSDALVLLPAKGPRTAVRLAAELRETQATKEPKRAIIIE